MKVIILAAGYATRLYPLTLNQPKPLLKVAGKPIIEHVLDNLAPLQDLDCIYIVTNAKFTEHFQQWADQHRATQAKSDLVVINDGSTDDSNKLGAIGDLHFVLTREQINDDLIIIAGDNLLNKSLEEFGEFCRQKNAPVVGVYDVGNLEETKKYNSIKVDGENRILFFEEKPQQPQSTVVAIALYYYPKHMLPLIEQYIAEGNNPDQPGRLVQWMYQRTPFYTWRVTGIWYDIGSKETLAEANRIFATGGDE